MKLFLFLSLVLIASTPSPPTFALKRPYIVYMGGHSHGLEVSELVLLQAQETHFDLLGSFVGRDTAKESIFYSYTRHINGFAAMLEEEQASAIAKHPEVVSVFLDKGSRLQTTRSWSFLGVEDNDGVIPHHSIWNKARFGEDSIIANLDTGVWPESESFDDKGMSSVPTKWKGKCENDTISLGVRCNRKLIGARYFINGYLSYLISKNLTTGDLPVAPLLTPRDANGHGTHTLSTAAGAFVPHAAFFGFGNGTAKGGSPRARVASYKVCWPPIDNDNSCSDSDLLAAFDAAIADGVDVISASLVSDLSPLDKDASAIGAFHAAVKGIPVVFSAGNDGSDSSVCNVSPWQFTVGASTIDRDFLCWLDLGNHTRLRGKSLAQKSLPHGKMYSIISAVDAKVANASADDAQYCLPGALDHEKAKGKILVCLTDETDNVAVGKQAALAGAIGMILSNDQYSGEDVIPDAHVLPTAHVTYSDGITVFSYINTTKFPVAYFTRAVTQLNTKPAPVMASFSSRGPNAIIPEILKPDITAPGVKIIAAYTEANGPTDELFDKRRVTFNALSGTSMSCPHVSGIVGLLRTLYPHWSPAAIKSSIMTTAVTVDNVMRPIHDAYDSKDDPFGYGAGHVQPNLAMDPGLVYDLTSKDYMDFICSLGYNSITVSLFTRKPYACHENFTITNLNYPSITVPNLKDSITIFRTLKNVGSPATYKASIRSPTGIKAVVKPSVLTFDETGQEQTFYLTLKKLKTAPKDYVFGRLTWSDGKHNVRSPIVVNCSSY